MLLLDTSVLVRWGDPRRREQVVPYLSTHSSEPFVTSSLVTYEFFRPAKRRENRMEVQSWLGQALDDVKPFTEDASIRAATIEGALTEQDTSLAHRDLLIASHARELDATFVTCDRNDFQRDPVQQLLNVHVIESN